MISMKDEKQDDNDAKDGDAASQPSGDEQIQISSNFFMFFRPPLNGGV